MFTLDCSSLSSTRASVAQLLGVSVDEVRARARRLPANEYIDVADSVDVLTHGETITAPTWVYWFHASRVVDPDLFLRDGILTRRMMWPRLEEHLRSLAAGIEPEGSYRNGMSAGSKLGRAHDGPYGFLLRSVAVHAPDSTHNYHHAPEGVEDVAGKIVGGRYMELVERFRAVTVPCVVRFRTPAIEYAIEHALHFVCLAERSEELFAAFRANTCFNGEGRPVAPTDIVDVETL